MLQAYGVYALVDPRDNMARYIGRSKHPDVRYLQHLSQKDKRNKGKNSWISELRSLHLVPHLIILEEMESLQESIRREAYWTIHYARLGHPLTNLEKTRLGYPAQAKLSLATGSHDGG